MKLMTEDTAQTRVSIKGGSAEFGCYAPVICSTNLATEADFESKQRELRGELRSAFDLEDWRKVFSHSEGRFRTIIFDSEVPKAYRYAPRSVHRRCANCSQRLWKWFCGQAAHPRVFTASDIHQDSSDEEDHWDGTEEHITEAKTVAEKRTFLTQRAALKQRHRKKHAATVVPTQRATDWVRLTADEKDLLAEKRAGTKSTEQKKRARAKTDKDETKRRKQSNDGAL